MFDQTAIYQHTNLNRLSSLITLLSHIMHHMVKYENINVDMTRRATIRYDAYQRKNFEEKSCVTSIVG